MSIIPKLTFIGALISATLPAQAVPESIHFASNIHSGAAVLEIVNVKEKPGRTLLRLDLASGAKTRLPWPSEVTEEEVVAGVLLETDFYLITQWTAGDGKKPHLYRFDIKEKTWSSRGEIPCISFDTLDVTASQIKIHCQPDPHEKEQRGAEFRSVAIPKGPSKSLRLIFPLNKHVEGAFEYKLQGSLMKWKSITFKKSGSPQKTASAEELNAPR